jgi:predicted TIM-barrel fold metal-dependent hydrolase
VSPTPATAAGIRSTLSHPVIDADGHILEFNPALDGYLRAQGLSGGADDLFGGNFAGATSFRRPWWNRPARNTRDLLTAALPDLLYQRLDDLGLDFVVLYPTSGLGFLHMGDEDVRRGACRALNRLHIDLLRDHRDRIEPVAVVPAHTPEEGLEELEDAVSLGYKVVVLPGYVRRGGGTLDLLGLDSAYDYDPVWRRCVELDLPVSFHSGAQAWEARHSPSNFMFNHIGSFAAGNDALCRSLFIGGVTARFPDLRVAFLEGGVAWAVSLFCDLLAHWEKRNANGLANYDPRTVDRDLVQATLTSYLGRGVDASALGETIGGILGRNLDVPEGQRDEWSQVEAMSEDEFAQRFLDPFYFGCEADDPMTYTAFNRRANPLGAELKAIFSSDIGHWDVPDMASVLPEAYEAVDHQMLTEDDFRRFTFSNAARFYGGPTGRFFEGTAVEQAVKAEVAHLPT